MISKSQIFLMVKLLSLYQLV